MQPPRDQFSSSSSTTVPINASNEDTSQDIDQAVSSTTVQSSYTTVDYRWFDDRFGKLLERLAALESSLNTVHRQVAESNEKTEPTLNREYYSVSEFSELVGRGEYTVREWCRLARIHAEKCDSGRGEAKSWKIPAEELTRYRDHGLLPVTYLR